MPSPDLHQADRLTEEQVAQFKRDGLLVLPGVLDPLPNSPPLDRLRGCATRADFFAIGCR